MANLLTSQMTFAFSKMTLPHARCYCGSQSVLCVQRTERRFEYLILKSLKPQAYYWKIHCKWQWEGTWRNYLEWLSKSTENLILVHTNDEGILTTMELGQLSHYYEQTTGWTSEESRFDIRQVQKIYIFSKTSWLHGKYSHLSRRYGGLFVRV